MPELLTASRLSTRRTCPRQDFYSYEMCWRPAREKKVFRFGSAFHRGLECKALGFDPADCNPDCPPMGFARTKPHPELNQGRDPTDGTTPDQG